MSDRKPVQIRWRLSQKTLLVPLLHLNRAHQLPPISFALDLHRIILSSLQYPDVSRMKDMYLSNLTWTLRGLLLKGSLAEMVMEISRRGDILCLVLLTPRIVRSTAAIKVSPPISTIAPIWIARRKVVRCLSATRQAACAAVRTVAKIAFLPLEILTQRTKVALTREI